jgi:hypothetical protein
MSGLIMASQSPDPLAAPGMVIPPEAWLPIPAVPTPTRTEQLPANECSP